MAEPRRDSWGPLQPLARAVLPLLRFGVAPLLPPGSRLRDGRPIDRLRRIARDELYELGRAPLLARLAASALWPPVIVAQALSNARRKGDVVERELGLSRARQVLEQLSLAWRYDLTPANYYEQRLFDPAVRERAPSFIQEHELRALLKRVNEGLDWRSVDDKQAFNLHCRAHGLPVPELFAVFRDRELSWCGDHGGLPPRDVVLKPTSLRGGVGFERWAHEGETWTRKGERLDAAGLIERARQASRDGAMLIQERLLPHPDVRDLSAGGTLCTARVVTWRAPDGMSGLIEVFVRMPALPGVEVDNIFAGGVGSTVEPGTGRMGPARRGHVTFERHPLTGALIAGRTMPLWEQLGALCRRAHDTLPQFAFVGWDVALAEGGLSFLEANTIWGVPDHPLLGDTPFVELALARLDS